MTFADFSLRGIPRKTTPKTLLKHNIAIVPTSASPDIAKNTTKVENLRFDSNLFLTYEEKQELLEFAKECKQIRLSEEYKENVIKPKEENNIDDDYDEPDI